MYQRILQILHDSVKDSSIYMVVLTGTGNFFCSGNDFISRLSQDNLDLQSVVAGFKYVFGQYIVYIRLSNTFRYQFHFMWPFRNFVDTLITFPKLLVAIVNGPAIGLAVTILPLFDMVYASDMVIPIKLAGTSTVL